MHLAVAVGDVVASGMVDVIAFVCSIVVAAVVVVGGGVALSPRVCGSVFVWLTVCVCLVVCQVGLVGLLRVRPCVCVCVVCVDVCVVFALHDV